MDQAHSFAFEASTWETAGLSSLAAEMFDAVARLHAGTRVVRPASIHIDFTARKAAGALQGNVQITKSTASVLFMSAELVQGDESVLRASALYGFAED